MTTTDEINQAVVGRLFAGEPVLEDVRPAGEAIPGLGRGVALHAGPPIAWDAMCGSLRGAIAGALRLEGWAATDADAAALVRAGGVALRPAHDHDAVGPMTGLITAGMPVFVVRDRTFGSLACSTINEGIGRALRFGANGDE